MAMKRIATWAAVLTLCTAASASAQLRAVRVDAFALMTGTLHSGMDFTLGENSRWTLHSTGIRCGWTPSAPNC